MLFRSSFYILLNKTVGWCSRRSDCYISTVGKTSWCSGAALNSDGSASCILKIKSVTDVGNCIDHTSGSRSIISLVDSHVSVDDTVAEK